MIPTDVHHTASAAETAALGTAVARQWRRSLSEDPHLRTMCLYGDLGSGKTTFMQGLAVGWGITSRLLSPTFVLMKRYAVPDTSFSLVHADLYRLDGKAEIAGTGLPELFLDPSSLVCIEWAERLEGIPLPPSRFEVRCLAGDREHTITVARYGR
jgi:tRNA threonylcarbamoyladenosine biosynthesis protein TsaE